MFISVQIHTFARKCKLQTMLQIMGHEVKYLMTQGLLHGETETKKEKIQMLYLNKI